MEPTGMPEEKITNEPNSALRVQLGTMISVVGTPSGRVSSGWHDSSGLHGDIRSQSDAWVPRIFQAANGLELTVIVLAPFKG